MPPRALATALVLGTLLLAACGSSSSNKNGTALKDLHSPGQAATATPPQRLTTPLAAVAVSGAGGASVGARPETYVVKPGDTLNAIATQLGVSAQDLMRANNITDPTRLQVGQSLQIPKPGAPTPSAAAAATAAPVEATPGRGPTAGSGSSFPATGGAPGGGGALGTPGPAAATQGAAAASATQGAGGTEYTVQGGDTACKIARDHDISVQELAQANGMTKDQIARLALGQLLKLPPATGHRDC